MATQSPRAPYRKFGKSNGFGKPAGPKPEPKILFQQFFKSVGPRTYVAQLKEAANGNHFLVLTEGKRDEKTNEVRKSRIFIYSEDFISFFKLMKQSSIFIKDHPLDDKIKAKRDKIWAKKNSIAPTAEPAPTGLLASASS